MPWRNGSSRRGRRFGRGGRGPSRRRPLEWECSNLLAETSLPPNTCDQSVILPRADFDEEYSDSTLIRVRGELVIAQDPAAVILNAMGAAGIIEVEGVDDLDAIPYCPFGDCDASWLWHQFWFIRTDQSATAGRAWSIPWRATIDAAAQRRLEAGDSSLWMTVESDAASEGNVIYWWAVRMLLAEK